MTPNQSQPSGNSPVSQVQVQQEGAILSSSAPRDEVSLFASTSSVTHNDNDTPASPPSQQLQAQLPATDLSRTALKRKLFDTGHSTTDDPPVRRSPCSFNNSRSTSPAPPSPSSEATTFAAPSPSTFTSPNTPCGGRDCDVGYEDDHFSSNTTFNRATATTFLRATPPPLATIQTDSHDYHHNDHDMTATPVADHDAAPIATTPAPPTVEAAPFLGPSNPISKKPPSRSQSPAKRLKSEEPSSITLDDAPEPMDEDTTTATTTTTTTAITDVTDTEATRNREQSVDMVDVAPSPETAGPTVTAAEDVPMDVPVDVSADMSEDVSVDVVPADVSEEVSEEVSGDSSTATSTQPSTAASSTAASVLAPRPPPPEEQVNMVIRSKTMPLTEGEIMYMISGSWLKRFMAQDPDYQGELAKEELGKKVGPIDNSDIVDTTQLEEIEKRKSDDSKSISSASSSSADDVIAENFIPIKNLQMGEDFEALPRDVWNNLIWWYGLAKDSPIIRRKVVNTCEERGAVNLQVELHPPMFTVYRLRDPAFTVTKESLSKEKQVKPKKVVGEKAEGFQKFLKKIKSLAGIESGRKVRLWMLKAEQLPTEEPTEKAAKKPTKATTGTLKQMVLDLQAFLAVNPELINIPDHSTDSKYNGNMRLGTAGLALGGPIVIEEQSSNGEWISESPTKSTTKFGEMITVAKHGLKSATTSKKKLPTASPSRSSSPVKIAVSKPTTAVFATRGRERTRPLGTCGLSNLGNTCYMNSALQCLRSVEELSKYFLSHEYEKELNPDNPLAHHGKVARAYAGLLKAMFASHSPVSVAPRDFKNTVGRFGPSFSGYQQQDSQEFLAFLLDGMHEDLNRIMKKPYVEKPDSTDEMVGDKEAIKKLAEQHWEIYKGRNDSAVADLFGGLYKSTLVCPECSKVSITFDPFMDLTLPLPIESCWSKEITWFPKDNMATHSTLVRVQVELPKQTSIGALKEQLGKKFGADPKKMMVSEVYKYKFYKHFDDSASVSEIQPSDELFVYELEDAPTSWPAPKTKTKSMLYFDDPPEDQADSERLLVPVYLKREQRGNRRYATEDAFGIPFFTVLNRDEQYDYETIVEKLVQKIQLLTTRNLYEESLVAEEPEDEELVNASEVKETQDEEKDGFVDVTMRDAASTTASEDAEATLVAETGRRRVPPDTATLFTIKISKRKESARLPAGWSAPDGDIELSSRLQPSRNRTPTPPPQQQQPSALFSGLASVGNSGRRTPASQISDEEEEFLDAPEPTEDMMQGSSDEELETTYSGAAAELDAFPAPSTTDYYGVSNNNSSLNVFNSPHSSPLSVNSGPLVRLGEAIIIEFNEDGYDTTFGGNHPDDFRGSFASWPLLRDPELTRRRQLRAEKEKRGTHLEDCLDEFAKEEVLSAEDPWYCPRCKEHRQASKKFELWKCPDILVIHLKRFSSSRSFRDKIDAHIICPTEGLDLGTRVGVTDGKEQIYDLIAVDNHYGGLGGGHYTAYMRNWIDGKWYYCDDSSVREANANSVVTPAAYLLFYRRRSSKPLGGPQFERIMAACENGTASDEEDEQQPLSREATPSPTPGTMIGPIAPPQTGFRFGYSSEPVGNSTLWGDSIAPGDTKDEDELELEIEPLGGVSLDEDTQQQTDEGIGADQEDSEELYNGLFVPAVAVPEDDQVNEVRVGEGEGLQG